VFDLGEHDGAPFIVSELLEGQTLRERLAESPLPQRKALDYAAQIAAGRRIIAPTYSVSARSCTRSSAGSGRSAAIRRWRR
jgi:hypothetical protein